MAWQLRKVIENKKEEYIMQDKSKVIFNNEIDRKAYRKAINSKKKYARKYGDDSNADYKVTIKKNKYIGDMLGVYDVRVADKPASVSNGNKEEFDTDKGIIVGNIRMGFGHYRISMAIASAANALGYVPYWMDLNSYDNTTCTKVIRAQNDLYSLGSRLSQKSRLFNRLVWEPMNYEGFRKLSYNASDQKNAELMAPVYKNVPKNIPVIATHVWPAQAAVHAGMKNVVNAIPDNWPMALHLSEGSIHTVQTHYAYQGYRILNGMSGIKVLNEMPADSLVYTGHYIDHELVTNIEADCNARIARKQNGKPMRFLLTIGGAGAQKEIFAHIIKYLIPYIKKNKAVLYVNVGDYKNVWDELIRDIPQMRELATEHFDNWKDTKAFATKALSASQINNSDVVTDNNRDDNSKNITADNSSEDTSDNITGIHGFYHKNIFEAVYCTREKSTVDVETVSVKQMFKALFQNDQAVTVVITIVLINTSVYITSNLVIYFFKYDFGGADWYNGYTLFNTFGGAIQILSMMVLFPLLRKFLNTIKIFYVSFVMAIAGYIVLFILIFTSMSSVFILFIPAFFIFAANGMLLVLTTIFLANTVDYGEFKNKRRDESVIFSMQTFVVKLASGIAALVVSICLSVCRLSSNTDVVTDAVAGGSVVGLRMTMTVIPVIGLLIAVFYFHRKYILTEQKMEEISERIKESH